jgi:IS30 family transposase
MSRASLLRSTEGATPHREIVVLEDSHQAFLAAVVDEVRARTGRRIDRSAVIRALIDTMLAAEMSPDDIVNAERKRARSNLHETHDEIYEEIRRTEEALRLALVDYSLENDITREYRRALRYQRERLKAVEQLLDEPSAPSGAHALSMVQAVPAQGER